MICSLTKSVSEKRGTSRVSDVNSPAHQVKKMGCNLKISCCKSESVLIDLVCCIITRGVAYFVIISDFFHQSQYCISGASLQTCGDGQVFGFVCFSNIPQVMQCVCMGESHLVHHIVLLFT